MKTKVRNSVKKRKSLKKATKKATKKASKKTTKRQKKLLNYKNKNTRKNKRGGDAASVAVPIAAGVLGSALLYNVLNKKNKNNKTNKNDTRKYQYSHQAKRHPITNNETTLQDKDNEGNNTSEQENPFASVPIESDPNSIKRRAKKLAVQKEEIERKRQEEQQIQQATNKSVRQEKDELEVNRQ